MEKIFLQEHHEYWLRLQSYNTDKVIMRWLGYHFDSGLPDCIIGTHLFEKYMYSNDFSISKLNSNNKKIALLFLIS